MIAATVRQTVIPHVHILPDEERLVDVEVKNSLLDWIQG